MANSINIGADIIDSRDIIERLEELEGSRLKWSAGWNMTGCLCDSGPESFSDYEDAKQCILDMLQMAADSIGDEGAAESIESAIQDINLESNEFSIYVEPLGYWYWVAPYDGDDTHEDEDDAEEYRFLCELRDEFEGYADWEYGETVISAKYFTDYAIEMLKDCGDLPANIPWYIEIDEEATAENIKADYSSCDTTYGGTYYCRCV